MLLSLPRKAAEEDGPILPSVVGRRMAGVVGGEGRRVGGASKGGRSVVVGEGFVAQEHVPGRRFYVVFAVFLLATALLCWASTRRPDLVGRGEPGSTVWIWLLAAVAAALAAPDLAQYALLRRFGARPRRVNRIERGSRPLFARWRAPDHVFTQARFVVS